MAGSHLNQPIVGISATPDGKGYWLAAADGGVFAFGAPFLGSLGGTTLSAAVVGMSPSPVGAGYYLLGADSAVYAFENAQYLGAPTRQGESAFRATKWTDQVSAGRRSGTPAR